MNREVWEEMAAEVIDRSEHESNNRAERKAGIKLVMAELKRGLADLDTIDDEDDEDDEIFAEPDEEPN